MSTVVLDTITGKSTATTITIGSTPVVSASANSMTIRGEGSAQTSIQQGLAKAWVVEDHKTSNEIKDSLNVASITDVGTGVSKFFYTNNMAGSEYAALSGMSSGVYNGACNMPSSSGGDDGWTMATTYWHHSTRGNGTTMTLADCERVVSGILGDLA